MAAAEYFNPSANMAHGTPSAPGSSSQPPPSQQQQPPPPQQPQQQPPRPNHSQGNLNVPYPISDAPPPYTDQPRPHSQPPPGQRPQVRFDTTPYQPYRPNQPTQPNVDTHQYPSEKPSQQPQQRPPNIYRQSDYGSSNPPYPQQQPNGYPTPVAPGLSQVYPSQQQWQQPRPTSAGNQSPYRRSSRSRSRSRERRRRHGHKPRPDQQRPKEGGMNTFLGASGGAVIGDLIFPGLGTLGGAILGGVGGHEYTRNKSTRSSSNPSRAAYRRSYSNSADYYADDYRRGRN